MTRQFKKNQLKQFKNQSQSGRSMVEMLGVLAIIAILSIGGIVGYKLAMNYYQADQIANEINLMRNDLKVKYALGNEELLLGDPYDDTPENEDYSGHLSTQYDRYPVDYDCIIRGNKESKNELYNCREADAYYIAVGNISKGVCKPLTTLVAAMDGRLEMDINGISYTEGDSCTSDENNEIYVEFDAADVNGNYDSGRPEGWCAKDDDCEGLSTPVCDKENNTCVECMKNADCASNVCRGDYTCGECTKDSDCVNPRPICDTEAATCIGCVGDDECQRANVNKPVCDMGSGACCDDLLMTWNGSECICPEGYGVSETTSGKKMCLPYCKEKEESGLIILIDQSGSMSDIVTEAGITGGARYDRAIEMLEEAVGKLTIPEEINAAVYLAGCSNQSSDPTKSCYGSCDGLKITNSHLTWGKHSASEIQAALKIDELDKKTSRGQCSGVGYAVRDEIIPLCKTGGEKFIVIIYWDNNDGGVNTRMDTLLQKCPQTKIYNVALSGKPYAGAAGNFNLNNINDLNNDINNALNEAIQEESCVQRPGG